MPLDLQKNSVNGNLWEYAKADERLAEMYVQKFQLPYVLGRILSARGIDEASVPHFLNPKIADLLPDPSCLKDMDKASKRLAEAVINGEKIGIIGDYDVDGATSTSVMKRFLTELDIVTKVHIPSRDEGYGPNRCAFDEFKAEKIKLVLTLDCGTTAFEVLDAAQEDGFDVIVLDHHEAETKLPKVFAVVNPKRLDEQNMYPYLKYMAAVGVVFMSVVAVNRELKKSGFYENHTQPDLLKMLDLVALGTVCDVVPLLGLNRAFVRQGLKIMQQGKNFGIKALSLAAKINERLSAYHLGFVLGPRINAGGRVGDSNFGYKLLCAANENEAGQYAEKLNAFNQERKDIEADVLLKAIEQLESEAQSYPIAFAYGQNWHQGVIGIVAGKLKERYNMPAFVMSVEEDGVKGSARSVDGVDLGALIIAAKEAGILTNGGGHMMAAGFSLSADKIEEFKAFAGEYVKAKAGDKPLTPVISFDALITLAGANMELSEKMAWLEPFGASNPEPKVVIENVKIVRANVFSNGHIRCFLSADFAPSLKAVAFRAVDTNLGQTMLNAKNQTFNVLGVLRKDEWLGNKTLQFIIEDIMKGE